MKKIFGNIICTAIIALAFIVSLTGCYESHYYHEYNHHTREWYGHRHQAPPANVNFEVDVYHRGHHRH
jgi:hypothetical protein